MHYNLCILINYIFVIIKGVYYAYDYICSNHPYWHKYTQKIPLYLQKEGSCLPVILHYSIDNKGPLVS